jgi:ribonuclease BN (tRNA processing enzyme)
MKLVMLGTGGLIPTDAAQTACFFLPEVGVLLDAGSGLYRMSSYLQTTELNVYLSHAHGDHTSGLVYLFASFLIQEIQSSPDEVDESNIGGKVMRANERLHTARIHATQTAIDFLAKEYEPYQMDFHRLNSPEALPGRGTLTHFDLGHNDEVGFRLDWPGHSLAYITDTAAVAEAEYIQHIRGVDVLLHDGYGPERLAALIARTGHTTCMGAAGVAAQARVKRLYLVHRNPLGWSVEDDLPRARQVFPYIEVGKDGMEVEF